jgi:GxxExxY protein
MPLNNYNDLPLNLDNLSKEVVDCAFQVHKKLGPGFLEKNYEEAFCIELNKKNIPFERQKIFKIPYGDQFLNSEFRFDLLIDDQIIVELKSVDQIHPIHQAQIYAYLNASKLQLGFLINFNVKLIKDGIKRHTLRNFDASR